jgi:hypothetical protein
MSPILRFCSLVSGLALTAAVSGCSGEASPGDSASLLTSEPGWLILDWTIAGEKSAEQCDQGHAATVAVSVTLANGDSERIYQNPCVAFNSTITLAPANYAAQAELLDGADGQLTTPITLPPFEIASGTPLRLPLEFPRSSFHAPAAQP